LPLVIKGTVDKPKVEIDYSSMLNNAKGDVKEGAKKLLEGLFKKK